MPSAQQNPIVAVGYQEAHLTSSFIAGSRVCLICRGSAVWMLWRHQRTKVEVMIDTARHDPYLRHRLALSIVGSGPTRSDMEFAIKRVHELGVNAFSQFLVWHKLAPLWYNILENNNIGGGAANELKAALRGARFIGSISYGEQKRRLRELDALFVGRGISYAVIKGVGVREIAYQDPSLRPASDIDILVRKADRMAAAQVLIEAGYRLRIDQDCHSHEATFTKGSVEIDLHWDILRPGRTRCDVVTPFLARRERNGQIWTLALEDAVLLALTHPAFAKHITSPNMALVGVVDLMLMVENRKIDWIQVGRRLDCAGLKTAAWAVSTWLAMIGRSGATIIPQTFVATLQPNRLKKSYLVSWLKNDLATSWLEHPMRVQIGLTLFLHDRPSDAMHAFAKWFALRRARHDEPMLMLWCNRTERRGRI